MRRPLPGSLVTLGAVAMLMPLNAHTQTATTLAALRDNSRPVLVFAPEHDLRAQQQVSDLATHAAEVRDRDIKVILIAPNARAWQDRGALPQAFLSPAEEAHARQRFHVAPDTFTVVLLGKDGGEKLRSGDPIPWQKLASTIDSMPMRQDEMKQR